MKVAVNKIPFQNRINKGIFMKLLRAIAASAALLFGTLQNANAGIATFEDVVLTTPYYGGVSYSFYAQSSGRITSGGFDFAISSNVGGWLTNGQICGPSCPVNGTNVLLLPYDQTVVTMSKNGGGTFGLSGFDGAGAHNFNESNSDPRYIPTQIDVTGRRADGSEITQSFAIDRSIQSGPLKFTTYSFDDRFVNLISVSFSSSGSLDPTYNGLTIDNISSSEVPEPASFSLLSMGLVGLIVQRKAKCKKNV